MPLEENMLMALLITTDAWFCTTLNGYPRTWLSPLWSSCPVSMTSSFRADDVHKSGSRRECVYRLQTRWLTRPQTHSKTPPRLTARLSLSVSQQWWPTVVALKTVPAYEERQSFSTKNCKTRLKKQRTVRPEAVIREDASHLVHLTVNEPCGVSTLSAPMQS